MTIRATLLAKGYFPKELPPAFYTEAFAAFASSRTGRAVLAGYPTSQHTDAVEYSLALPGFGRRDLHIPHPVAYARLVAIAAASFGRLLTKARRSPFSRSRPVYSDSSHRAVTPQYKPANLPRERALARLGASFVLKADISHFYPSLYTHAVGWAVDARARDRKNWRNKGLLGVKVDDALMGLQARVTQGIPVGPDLSFLLAEVVLGEVDKRLGVSREAGYRWFDDYEFACSTRAEAEALLAKLKRELDRFHLRLNPAKTEIKALPQPAEESWRDALLERSRGSLRSDREILGLFDLAFRLRDSYPHASVLVYALGILFKVRCPTGDAAAVALSCITQCLTSEPGAAQKAFALLTYWTANGLQLDRAAVARTTARIVALHDDSGLTSDVAWSLAFCLDMRIPLDRATGRRLSHFSDDAVAIQACELFANNLLPAGFTTAALTKRVPKLDPDGEHWLGVYELVRQGYATNAGVSAHPVLGLMLREDVPFYRKKLPTYAALLHPGGAPDWAIAAWLRAAGLREPTKTQTAFAGDDAVTKQIAADLGQLPARAQATPDQVVTALFGQPDRDRLIALANVGEY
jgi:hypothetical protein